MRRKCGDIAGFLVLCSTGGGEDSETRVVRRGEGHGKKRYRNNFRKREKEEMSKGDEVENSQSGSSR